MAIQRDPSLGVWLYPPSLTLAIIATTFYAIPLTTYLFLNLSPKHRSWPSLWIVIGALLEVIGYAARIASTRDYNSVVRILSLPQTYLELRRWLCIHFHLLTF